MFPKNSYYADIKIFNSLPSNLRNLMNKQTQFYVALKKELKYSLLSLLWGIPNVSELSKICAKKSFFYLLFVVWTLYNVCKIYFKFFLCYFCSIFKKYLSVVSSFSSVLLCFVVAAFICLFCIFMTYSTSYCCYDKLTDPWNLCIYVK
jgi:hypothetical protein